MIRKDLTAIIRKDLLDLEDEEVGSENVGRVVHTPITGDVAKVASSSGKRVSFSATELSERASLERKLEESSSLPLINVVAIAASMGTGKTTLVGKVSSPFVLDADVLTALDPPAVGDFEGQLMQNLRAELHSGANSDWTEFNTLYVLRVKRAITYLFPEPRPRIAVLVHSTEHAKRVAGSCLFNVAIDSRNIGDSARAPTDANFVRLAKSNALANQVQGQILCNNAAVSSSMIMSTLERNHVIVEEVENWMRLNRADLKSRVSKIHIAFTSDEDASLAPYSLFSD